MFAYTAPPLSRVSKGNSDQEQAMYAVAVATPFMCRKRNILLRSTALRIPWRWKAKLPPSVDECRWKQRTFSCEAHKTQAHTHERQSTNDEPSANVMLDTDMMRVCLFVSDLGLDLARRVLSEGHVMHDVGQVCHRLFTKTHHTKIVLASP